MPIFQVTVKKDYYSYELDDTMTVFGTIDVEAASQKEAEAIVAGWMEWQPDGNGDKTLQTIDPRITWDYEGYEDEVELAEAGYEYSDCTFEVGKCKE
jgi:hypothetical protein